MAVEALLSSLDDEEMRVLAAQEMGPFIPPMVTPLGLSSKSSIDAATEKEVPRHRPTLPAPKSYMRDVIGLHMKTETLTTKSAKLFDAEVAKIQAEIEELSTEKEEALKREAEAVKSRNTWSTISIVAQYISGASAIVLGLATFGVSAIAGGLLMASGGLGLINRILHDTPLLETLVSWWTKSEEMQIKITQNIEMGMFFLQMGLGLAGGLWAWQTGALAAAQATTTQAVLEKAKSIISIGSGVMMTGAQVGKAFYDKKILDLQARMKEITGQMTTYEQTMYQDTGQIRRMLESTQSENDELRKAIQTLQISFD